LCYRKEATAWPVRIPYANVFYHVSGGGERPTILYDDHDRMWFLDARRSALEILSIRLDAGARKIAAEPKIRKWLRDLDVELST
jgi:hypothetical protein